MAGLAGLPQPAPFRAKLTANGPDKLTLAMPELPAGSSNAAAASESGTV